MATKKEAYDPKAAQQKWLKFWEERRYFHSEPDAVRKPFTIVIPPPNVTGALHMGHALNNTLQDVLIRWRRMQGYNALWMPGTDHAGIATQSVVEKRILAEEKKTRHDLGREELVKRIWQWRTSTRSVSSTSSSRWAAPATGSGRGSLWTRSARGRCGRRSSACSATGTSTAASGW
jgi:valyl-tRNA synthetase